MVYRHWSAFSFISSGEQADLSAGLINSRLRIVRPVAWVGYALAGIGMILFYIFFKYPIPYALQEGLQVVTAVGVGLSLSTPILILQAAMPLKEMAAATSAWQLTRALGGSIGMSRLIYCHSHIADEQVWLYSQQFSTLI